MRSRRLRWTIYLNKWDIFQPVVVEIIVTWCLKLSASYWNKYRHCLYRISFVTISQAIGTLGTCTFVWHATRLQSLSYVSTLHALHFHDKHAEINKASLLKSVSVSSRRKIKTTAPARIVTGNNDQQKWYRLPQQDYLTPSWETQRRERNGATGYHETMTL